ncbi:hypothetical protein GCM10011425_05740 [Mucilaginibacter galii]|uniref:Uncharacterized protein n=2 Tax=Mucilaginibacter galii TaxID=2005073 RepID=A0A917J786_9SPHI|nr:hypothetical protein GCM10011425_05740 [Mucilaginibacter galii]
MLPALFTAHSLFAQNVSYGGDSTLTITYDMATKTIDISNKKKFKKLTRNDFYQIKVKNINQSLYKVSFQSVDTVISKALQTPTFGNFEIDAITKLIGGLSPLSTSIVKSQYQMEELYSSMEGLKTMAKAPLNKSIKPQLERHQNLLKNYLSNLQHIKASIDLIQLSVYQFELNALLLDTHNNCKPTTDYCTALQDILAIRRDIDGLNAQLKASQKEYLSFSEVNANDIEKDYADVDKEVKAAYTGLITATAETLAAINADKTRELLSRMLIAQNNSATEYTTFPIQFTVERAKISLIVSPRKDDYLLQTYTSNLMIPFVQKSYTAVGISFYGAGLHDEVYSTLGTPVNDSVTNYTLVNENASKQEIGVAALLRFGTKLDDKEFYGIHASIGSGISISTKVKPRMLLGAGLSFGKMHMFTVDGGLIAGYVDRLSAAANERAVYVKPEPVMVSKLKAGGFISFGYLFRL